MNPWVVFAIIAGAFMLSGKTALAYIDGKPVDIPVGQIGEGLWMRRDAASQFRQMALAARDAGVVLVVERAFATMEEQTTLWEKYVSGAGNLAAKPGHSKHQAGLAVDVDVDRSFGSRAYAWLEDNAHRYGFANTGKYFSQPEPWHWEYIA